MRFLGPAASDLKGLFDGLASRAVHLKVSIAHAKRTVGRVSRMVSTAALVDL
jgi:hypothetical protein